MISKLSISPSALLAGLFLVLGLAACQSGASSEASLEERFPKKLNLLEYGMPFSIQVPADAKVKDQSNKFIQDLVIEGQDYYLQIYGQDAAAATCNALAQEAQTDLKTTSGTFKKMVTTEDCGFLYQVETPNDTNKYYNFAWYRIQGNKSFNFSTTASRQLFTLDQVEAMYTAAKSAK